MRYVFGIDLSGPANFENTAMVEFESYGDHLRMTRHIEGASDSAILQTVRALPDESEIVIGFDAPLSYSPGGGDRPGDKELRRRAILAGLPSGSIMPPTMTKMVYLTLRGVVMTRSLSDIRASGLRIVEVHPGVAMAMRSAPVQDVRAFSHDLSARRRLLMWLGQKGLEGLSNPPEPSGHYVAACAAALAAWDWANGRSVWCHTADPPAHPFDFAV